ncbi:cytochrome-c oxidase, cbb3-type subunit III [Emcibacter sp.]|uniref:cytochrome-c oxidase, cbb3-type subunit III n=1 Tax=Emcibacter sp. TaxID=1979954 RepID=UPI003A9101D8
MPKEERDPYSGYLTTGHEWDGITELNRPVPRVIWLFLLATFLFALVWWVLMPSWPLGESYTKGILSEDQKKRLAQELAETENKRAQWQQLIVAGTYEKLLADPQIMPITQETGKALFGDNCAVCHGVKANGGPGFPSLTDQSWIWGGTAENIAETIRVGINSDHEDSRMSQMLAFGRDGMLAPAEISKVITYILSLPDPHSVPPEAAPAISEGAQIFSENCASCHGETGQGNIELGAPNLIDDFWIYGGDRQSIYETIYRGRTGQMPQWEHRLSPAERKLLVLYILNLEKEKP